MTQVFILPLILSIPLLISGCGPTVKVEAPEKPITINLNVNIEHEILLKVDQDLEALIDKNSDLF